MHRPAPPKKLQHFDVAHHLLHTVFVHIAITTMDLNSIQHDLRSSLCTIGLGQTGIGYGGSELPPWLLSNPAQA